MNSDTEVEQLRASVHCAALLEHLTAPWRLDKRESTQNCLKYRRGAGETLIVNHQGRGWWDPNSTARGDVFALVQHLEPGLNFGQVRKVLRQFAGVSPTFPEARRARQGKMAPDLPPAARWARCPKLRKGTPGWTYLATQRALPANVLAAASAAAVVRQGAYGSPWFAHRDEAGHVSHVEIRGPDFKGSLRGGTKILFRFPGGMAPPTRLVLTEAPIDALSLAALEGPASLGRAGRPDTLYAATGGGMGPSTIAAIERLLIDLASHPDARFCSATDANPAGDRYARQHEELAAAHGVAFERLRPPLERGDWNDILKTRRAA